jgi:hypothetical protein
MFVRDDVVEQNDHEHNATESNPCEDKVIQEGFPIEFLF